MHNKKKEEKKNHRSVQCNLLWLLQQLSAITILRSGSIGCLTAKASLCWDQWEINTNLLWGRVSCYPGWPQTGYTAEGDLELLFLFLHFPLAGVTGMYRKVWFFPVVGSEARTSQMLGKHAPNLSYCPGHEHQLSGLQRQEAAERPIWLPISSCVLSQDKISHDW